MKIAIPLTGKVVSEIPLIGDDFDGIRPVDIDLGNISWILDHIDLVNEVAVIEVTPSEYITVDTGKKDTEGKPIFEHRKATVEEKQDALLKIQDLIYNHTREELYEMSKCHKLKRPSKEK